MLPKPQRSPCWGNRRAVYFAGPVYLSGELGNLKEGYNAWQALLYVLWSAPRYIYEILPISALIGAVLGLGTLASNSELIIMRAAGISLWRIVGWVMRSALLLVILSFALSEWVIPVTNERAESVKVTVQLHSWAKSRATGAGKASVLFILIMLTRKEICVMYR